MFAGSRAFAHPMVEEGIRAYESAAFERAIELLSGAESQSDLSREDLVQLYRYRALAHAAMGANAALEADLRRVASLDAEIGREAPPHVQRVFARVREGVPEPVALSLEVALGERGLRFAIGVENDVASLVVRTNLYTRTGGSWRTSAERDVEVEAARDATVEYYAEALGPGGAVIVSEGTRDRPRTISRRELGAPGETLRTETSMRTLTNPEVAEPDEGSSAGWWILGGLGVAGAAAAVILVVLFVLPTDQTMLLAPAGDLP
jgi:hypothetical protein